MTRGSQTLLAQCRCASKYSKNVQIKSFQKLSSGRKLMNSAHRSTSISFSSTVHQKSSINRSRKDPLTALKNQILMRRAKLRCLKRSLRVPTPKYPRQAKIPLISQLNLSLIPLTHQVVATRRVIAAAVEAKTMEMMPVSHLTMPALAVEKQSLDRERKGQRRRRRR